MERNNQFALGQTFIRDYGITFNWIQREGGQTLLEVYVGVARERNQLWIRIVAAMSGFIILSGYLAYFSIVKFRRLEEDALLFEKI